MVITKRRFSAHRVSLVMNEAFTIDLLRSFYSSRASKTPSWPMRRRAAPTRSSWIWRTRLSQDAKERAPR